jgi:hypothetical protein
MMKRKQISTLVKLCIVAGVVIIVGVGVRLYFIYGRPSQGSSSGQQLEREAVTSRVFGLIEYQRKVVRPFIRQNVGSFQICYKTFLEGKPKITDGKVDLAWLIDMSGKVKNAKIEKSELQNPVFERCLLTELEKLQFPAPGVNQEVSANHVLNFEKEPE